MVDLFRYLMKIECHGYNRGWIFWTEKIQTLVLYPVFIHVDLIHFQIIFLKDPQVTIFKNISSFQENAHWHRFFHLEIWLNAELDQQSWLARSASKSGSVPSITFCMLYGISRVLLFMLIHSTVLFHIIPFILRVLFVSTSE